MARQTPRRKYSRGTITPLAGGKCDAYLRVGGQTLRRRLGSVAEAQAWIDAQDAAYAYTLTASQIRDAGTALAILPPGVTLHQCAQHYLATAAKENADQPILPLFEAFISARSHVLREETLKSYRILLNRSLAEIGNRTSDYSPDRIRRALSRMTPNQHNHILRALNAFFNWSLDSGDLILNPCADIKLARVPEPARQIFTLDQTRTLLEFVHEKRPDLLGYFSLCLFAGLRPTEARRITARHIGAEYITLDASITKTAQARTVPIEAGLRELIERFPLGRRSTTAIKRITQAFPLRAWSQDIMRHSYASYAYERSRDAAATAYNMGHVGTDIFFRHYRGLVPPNAGAQYFQILPQFLAKVSPKPTKSLQQNS